MLRFGFQYFSGNFKTIASRWFAVFAAEQKKAGGQYQKRKDSHTNILNVYLAKMTGYLRK